MHPCKQTRNFIFGLFIYLAEEKVTGGNLHFELKWGVITVKDKDIDLCHALVKEGDSCPLEPGSQTVRGSVAIPSYSPSVSHVFTLSQTCIS